MRRVGLIATLALLVPAAPASAWSHGQVVVWRQITLVFPKHYPAAHRVALCESGLTPRAENGQYQGVFQLSWNWRHYFGIGSGFNPYMNIRAAHAIYRGQGWTPWECAP